MTFLVFDNETLAQTALDQANANYGCPIILNSEKGYRMDQWDNLLKHFNDNLWSFKKPAENRMENIEGFLCEIDKRDSWYAPSED